MPDQLRHVDRVSGERELELVVIGAEAVGDEPCVGQLVVLAGLDEPDGERLDRPVHVARHEGDDDARVQPAAEHRAQGNVAHQPDAN